MKKHITGLLGFAAFYVFFRSFFWQYPPIWDGRIYYLYLLNAKEQPFDIFNYGVGGHLSQIFLMIAGAPYFIFHRDYYLFNVWLTFLSLVGIAGFYYLLKYFIPDKKFSIELVLMTAIIAFCPIVMASMIHFNTDIGLLIFFILFWVMLLYGRSGWGIVCGICMLFSKEPAIVLLPLVFLCSWLSQPVSSRIQWFKKNILTVIIPYAVLGIFLIYKTCFRSFQLFWNGAGHIATGHQYFLSFFDQYSLNYLVVVFVMNFNWLISLLLTLLVIKHIIKPSENSRQLRILAFLTFALLLVSFCALSLVRPYTNPRYLLIPITVMLVCVWQWLWISVSSRGWRVLILTGILVMFIISNFRTIDPLSKAYFGVFRFGKHEMLYMTKQTGEWSYGYGRDQLVYNLEFLKFPQILQKIMSDLRPSQNVCITLPEAEDFSTLLLPLDNKNYGMTFKDKNVITPCYMNFQLLRVLMPTRMIPPALFYIVLPNMVNTDTEIGLLCSIYKNRKEKIYEVDGYQMRVLYFFDPV